MKNSIQQLAGTPINAIATQKNDVVLALHCSGGNAKQWRGLTHALDARYEVHTPEHFGTSAQHTWSSTKVLTLASEAEQSLQIIDQTDKNVHLVGHSYGGALALHIALARPERISSLSLFEPCAFHLLPKLGVFAAEEMSEITALAAAIQQHTTNGDNGSAMHRFVDYWNGEGAWFDMKPDHQENLMAWAPNATNAFDALFAEESVAQDYRHLDIPVQLLQGACSPNPVHVVSASLSRLLPDCEVARLPGVGHMGPLTHAEEVARLMAEHIDTNTANAHVQSIRRRQPSKYVAVAA